MAEESSLARQLKKLAAPQTSLLLQDKLRASLLFDPKEASGLDRDTVFHFGSTGLDKLILVNPIFAKFEDALFSESSKTFERSVQTSNVNKKLDQKVQDFLTALSPYVLLRGAHEAMEWLIYRFHIHMFNVDSLIGCILPYYHTRIFVRAIQLIDLSEKSNKWRWLQPTKQMGEPLKLQVLLRRFNSDPSFQKFVCNLVPRVISIYKADKDSCQPIISFSTVMTYYAVRQQERVSDSLVSSLLPYVITGLKSDMPSLRAGMYLLVGTLVSKTSLATGVVEELLIRISESLEPAIVQQALETMMLICELQKVTKLPKKVFTQLCENDDSVLSLNELIAGCGNTCFFKLVIKKGIPRTFKREISKTRKLRFFISLLELVDLNKQRVKLVFSIVMRWYTKLHKMHKKNKSSISLLRKCGKMILNCLESRWPNHFDNAIESYFKKNIQSKNKSAWNLVTLSISSIKHELLPDSGVTLFVAVNHANDTIRLHAVEKLIQFFQADQVEDIEFLRESVVDRICDDNAEIALIVLSLRSALRAILPAEQLFAALTLVLKKHRDRQASLGSRVLREALVLLCMQYEGNKNALDIPLLEAIFPFLLPRSTQDVECLLCILESNFAVHPVIQKVKEDCRVLATEAKRGKKETLVELNSKVLASVQDSVKLLDSASKSSLLDYFSKDLDLRNCDASLLMGGIFIIESFVTQESETEIKPALFLVAITMFETVLQSERVSYNTYYIEANLGDVVSSCVKTLKKRQLPLSAICFALKRMMESFQVKMSVLENRWWPVISDCNLGFTEHPFRLSWHLFKFLLKYVNLDSVNCSFSFRALLGVFIKTYFPSIRELYRFLSYAWSVELHGDGATSLCIATLRMARALCKKTEGSFDWFFSDLIPVEFLSLLSTLCCDEEAARLEALDFLHCVLQHSRDTSTPVSIFADFISARKEEIISDHQQIFNVCELWLLPACESANSVSKGLFAPSTKMFADLLSVVCSVDTPSCIIYDVLRMLRKAVSPDILRKFVPVITRYINLYKNSEKPLEIHVNILELLLEKFSLESAATFDVSSEEYQVFVTLLQDSFIRNDQIDSTVQEIALRSLTNEFFDVIPSTAVQQKLLDIVVSMYIDAKSPKLNAAVRKVLKKLCVSAHLLLKVLPGDIPIVHKDTSLREAKKSRSQHRGSLFSEVAEGGPWKKITVILEIIQSKKKLNQKEILVAELFRLLHITLDWEKQPSVEYIRQLILSSISNCCKQLGIGGLEERHFQVELIIQCIRATENSKTHHQALLLLNLAAMMFPDYVLKNIMSIFTFMGSSLVRQDDSYSFQVISQTIETVVPALQEASKQKQEDDMCEVMASVTRLFVCSIPDIPRHRQLPLFTKLVNTLGPSDYLWIPLSQICERYACPSNFYDICTRKTKDKEIPPALEFAMNLHEQFPLAIQLDTCLNLTKHLSLLPFTIDETIKSKAENCEQKEPFDLTTHNDQQLQTYKKNVLCYLNQWLSSPVFLAEVLELEAKTHFNLEQQYEALLGTTLDYLHGLSGMLSRTNVPNASNHNEILLLLYELLYSLNSLLPFKLFIKVIKKLLTSPIIGVQRKAIEILNVKLEHQQKFFMEGNHQSLLRLLKPLLKIFKDNEVFGIEGEGMELNRQAALFSLHLMCKVLGREYPFKFSRVLPVVIDVLCHRNSHSKLVINSLLCLSELCKSLNALALPHLNTFMPHVIRLLEESVPLSDEYLASGLVIALQGLVMNLGAFLSSYMEPVLIYVCKFASECKALPNTFCEKVEVLCQMIAVEISPRVLFPSAEKVSEEFLNASSVSIRPLMAILSGCIKKTIYEELEDFLPQLRTLLLQLLEFRSRNSSELLPYIESIEDDIISCLITLVLKLSEPTFQTFYSDIYKWAVPAVFEDGKGDSKSKVLTFYKLSYTLAKNLKTLFVPVVRKTLRHAASVLDANNLDKTEVPYFENQSNSTEKSVLLLNYVIDTISLCYMYDECSLGEKECFDVVMQPLVDQIGNKLGGDEAFHDRIENHLSSCIAHFVKVFPDSSSWKSLNYQVLLKTKDKCPKVRFASLKVMREIVRKLGENYLVLLPETIPFFSALVEDKTFEVEKEYKDAISEMEKILGEPIKKYF